MNVSLGYNLSSPVLGSYAGPGTLLYQNVATNSSIGTQASAIDIGNLISNQTQLDVDSKLTPKAFSNYYSFNYQNDGSSSLKLAFQNSTASVNLRVQIFDSSGNIVADSNGTSDQVAAFKSLQSSNGLSADSGTYYAKVSYLDPSKTADQNYSLSFYSGSTFNAAYQTTALTAGAQGGSDPNSLGVYNSTGAQVYNRTTTNPVNGSSDNSIGLGTLITNQSQLSVVSQLNALVPNDFYNFNLQGTSLKLGFQNNTNTSNLRVQVSDKSGKVVADSAGTIEQQLAYAALSTPTGLTAKPGQYTVKVGYAPGALTGSTQKYALELYSGTTYTSSYQTTAQVPANAKTTVPVDNTVTFATAKATLSTRQDYNAINATATTGINIGWLAENKSQLSLYSQLTSADSTDYYNFTFQKGSALKLAFNNSTNTAGVRVQLTDQTGTAIIADNYGTAQQKTAFASLTSANGLKAQLGQYAIKVTYADGVPKTKAQTYNFQLTSGTFYSASYKTIASAQTINNAILSGNFSSTSAAQASVNYITNYTNGSQADIFSALSSGATSTLA